MNIHQQAILNHQLFYAIEQYEDEKDLPSIKDLVLKGADINMIYDENTPLNYAFNKGRQELIDFFIDNQEITLHVDWTIYNKDALILHPLFDAIYKGHYHVVKNYIEALPQWGIDKTRAYYSNNNILSYALIHNQLEIAEYFIGQNIGVRDHEHAIKHNIVEKSKFEKIIQNIKLKNVLIENPIVIQHKI